MKDLTRALHEIVAILDAFSVSYAVMGGVAVRIHGIPRPTYDLDFTVALGRERLQEFFDRAIDAGYSVAEPYRQGWVDQVAGMPLVKLRIYLQDHSVDVDVFLAESEFQESVLARRQCEVFENGRVWFVSPEDLILLKLIAGRPRDFVDVQDIFFTQGQLDEPYLRRWAAALGISKRLEQALHDSQTDNSA
ncbi:MAG: hypothetical protein EA424_06535 [Planctomycetaceae bacterium]|nr:MAG: hypothetical protein EA424_06535 [Planctomycetaceae bacterium]